MELLYLGDDFFEHLLKAVGELGGFVFDLEEDGFAVVGVGFPDVLEPGFPGLEDEGFEVGEAFVEGAVHE